MMELKERTVCKDDVVVVLEKWFQGPLRDYIVTVRKIGEPVPRFTKDWMTLPEARKLYKQKVEEYK
jgi:hypothetical protein